ncbi:MAG TPA: hypothetical protein VM123_01355 [archaeon]|nr:hypothetical protein [archaeon]
MNRLSLLSLLIFVCLHSVGIAYQLGEHPRILMNKAGLPVLARHAKGPLAAEYNTIKAVADSAVEHGVARIQSRFRPPVPLICCGICYLVERELGGEPKPYASAVKKYWGDGEVLNLDGDGYFGYHGMLYDWIYDALTPQERKKYGDQLGRWLRYYTDRPEIMLQNGYWWYNQTWGPEHLNTPNTRDGITPKLFVALGLAGAGTVHEEDARRYLDSWAERVPAECIPAFDEMGGVWSESMGHGGYGPVVVIPWAFEAWRTATGEDLFARCAPTSYLPEMTRWAVYLTVPFANHTAWIDDNRASPLSTFARIAPILGARYKDPVANWISAESAQEGWNRIPWERFLSYDPAIKPSAPGKEGYPTACLFKGAGHVYMLSKWDDPNATWAFFGAGPKFAGHSRDDEGHFLIAKKGWLTLRAGGPGHNDWDYYAGGSLAFNIVTIYDQDEQFRRTDPRSEGGVKNENDGGMIRYVYTRHTRDDRAKITSFCHGDKFTYAAADLSQGYSSQKVSEVTRQFFYLRGAREFFVIFDRIQATSASYPKHWFLHMPGEPSVQGEETVIVPGHVLSYNGNTATWLSDPAGEKGVLSTGRARAFLKTLLPAGAKIVKRGGEGHDFWGHPDEPTAQYNHVGRSSHQPPVVPWRLEVEAPGGEERSYFLHVIEIGDEGDRTMSEVGLFEREGYLGAKINAGGTPVEILFAARGKLTAQVKIGDEELKVLEANLE